MKINSMTFTHLLLASVLALASLAAQASGKFTYYAVDANGSRVVAMDESGAVIWRKTYAPYGKASSNDRDNRIGYTGHVENANGLVDAGARHYDPALGMFTSDDPVRFDENNPASFNRYAYANNNPYKYVDPSGKTPETIWDVGNVLVGAASFSANMAAGNYGGAAVDAVGVVVDAAAAITPLVPGGAGAAIKAVRGADKVADVAKGTTVYRQGTFADDAVGWKGNKVKGEQWATDNPLTTSDYAKKYGLPAENTGKPDWVVKGRIEGDYSTRRAPASHNSPANTGGGTEVLPNNPNDVKLDWFHMPD